MRPRPVCSATPSCTSPRIPISDELLMDNPDLWPNATEELIRFDSGLRMAARMTSEDLTIGDVTIPAGSNIIVNLLGRQP